MAIITIIIIIINIRISILFSLRGSLATQKIWPSSQVARVSIIESVIVIINVIHIDICIHLSLSIYIYIHICLCVFIAFISNFILSFSVVAATAATATAVDATR